MKRTGIRKRRRTKHQERNVEHRDYVSWIHDQPCAACGTRQNIQAAHVGRGGMGLKHGSSAMFYNLNYRPAVLPGCHADHDQCAGQSRLMTREQRQAWDAHQIAVHRGRFEASQAEPRIGVVPF